MNRKIEKGKYKHFKGKEYTVLAIAEPADITEKNKDFNVLAIAEHTETGKELVIYQSLKYTNKITHSGACGAMVVYKALYDRGKIYARPYEMFASKVEKDKYPEVEQEYRFEYLGGE